MRTPSTIHRRLLTLAVAVALPLIGLGGYGMWRMFDNERARAFERLELLQWINLRTAGNFVAATRHKLEQVAAHPDIRRMDPGSASTLLRDIVEMSPELGNMRLLDLEGRLVAYAVPVPEGTRTAILTNPAYSIAREAKGFVISEPYVSPGTGRWVFLASHPVVDEQGRRIGTLAGPLPLSEMAGLLHLPHDTDGLVVGLLSEAGTIVTRLPSPEAYIGRRADYIAEVRRQLDAGQDTIEAPGFDQSVRTALIDRVENAPWIVVTSLPTSVIVADARRTLRDALLSGTFVLLLAAYLVSRYARMISRPILTLADVARDQASGQTERLAPVAGPAEIAATAHAFNEMLAARRQAEALLAQSEHRYRTVIDQTGQMIYDLDLATNTIQWFGTEATPIITGYSLAEFQSVNLQRWMEMIHPDDRAATSAELDRAKVEQRSFHCEYRFRHKNGTYRNIEDHGVFIAGAKDRAVRLVGRMSDITARRRAEEERERIDRKLLETQKLESLGVLAGGIAHDFNNLLTGILGHAGLARLEAPRGWNGAEYLAQIEKASLRAADLCKQMLAYSGKGRFVVQQLSLNELLEDTAQLLHISISKKATLQLALDPSLPGINADPTQIRQIVMNLVINASEALGDRTGQITLHTSQFTADAAYLTSAQVTGDFPPGRAVCLEVSDTGSGMDRDTLPRIFDPFFTTKFTGRGLGLAAVLGIVRGHRGAIKVYSEPGRGTTFRVLFPAAEGMAQPLPHPVTNRENWRGRGTVLVIDDEPAVREVARSALIRLGFAVETAGDGAAGLALFQADPARYTAVLLDLTMPQMDGEEAFRQLRLLHPGVRVVLMSGFNRVDAINRFVGKGLAGFIQKPFEIDALTAELRRVIEKPATPD